MTGAPAEDPQRIIDAQPLKWCQYVGVGLIVALNALDGFDVLSSAFAAPGIAKEWGVPRKALGCPSSEQSAQLAA